MATREERYREKAEAESQALVTTAGSLVIRDDTEYEAAAEFVAMAKDFERQVEAHHAPMKRKAEEMLDAVRLAITSLVEPARQAVRLATLTMEHYLDQRVERQDRMISKAVASNKPVPVFPTRPKPRGVRVQESVWEYEIIDESAIKPEFTRPVPDRALIRDTVKTMGDDAAEFVGGIRVWRRPHKVIAG